ncbi:MAG: PH domain-containing protein [Proteobacteria bacterium]|nr:PH domain-containing protein [Pseudomonadota bacterium]MDA1300122.1 PH domain-containing protein [Pseudomonadota bacterium]
MSGTTGDWSRLSVWSVIAFSFNTLGSVAGRTTNLLAALPAVVAVYSGVGLAGLGAVAAFSTALIIGVAVLKYRNFQYLIGDSSIQVRQGVVAKRHLDLEFRRVQNLNIEQPVYFRPFRLVSLKVEGAGSSTEEIVLSALTIAAARAIREKISSKRGDVAATSGQATENSGSDQATHDPQRILTRSLSDLVIHGLTNNRAWIILGGAAAFFGQFADQAIPYAEQDLGFDPGGFIEHLSFPGLALIVISALLLALAATAVLSVLGAIMGYWGFELLRSDEGYQARFGLFNRREINVLRSRIQAIRIRRDWLDMLLGRMNVLLGQIHGRFSGSADGQLYVPSLLAAESDRLVADALGAPALDEMEFLPVSRHYLFRELGILVLLYWPAATLMSVMHDTLLGVGLALPIFVTHAVLRWVSWSRWGIAVTDEFVVVRRGVVGVDHSIIPLYKLQRVAMTQSLLMRRRGLSTLRLWVASYNATVPWLPQQFVQRVVDFALYRVESTSRSWM